MPPFFSTFNPQQSLATAFAPRLSRKSVQGTWVLAHPEQLDDRGHGHDQGLVAGLPEAAAPVGPGRTGQRRLHRQFPNLHARPGGCPVEPGVDAVGPGLDRRGAAGPGGGSDPSGRVTGLAIDPSDPSGNTVYAAGAGGGIWKTTDFLTTSPRGPDLDSAHRLRPDLRRQHRRDRRLRRNNNPNQSIVVAATGEGDTGTPGVGFLISHGWRGDLESRRQHRQRGCQRQPAADQLRQPRPSFVGDAGLRGDRRS